MNSIEMMERRQELVKAAENLLDNAEGRELDQDEQTSWDNHNREIDELNAKIGIATKREKLEAVRSESRTVAPRKTSPLAPTGGKVVTRSDRNKALKSWLSYGHTVPGMVHDGETFNRCSEAGYCLSDHSINLRSLNTSSASTGGDATFTTTSPNIQTELKYFSPIVGKVSVQQTGDGNTFTVVQGSDLNVMSIVGQGSDVAITGADASFSKVSMGAYTFRYVELVTYEQLQDSVFDLESWVTSRLAERAARTVEKYIVSGTGSSQPKGIVKAALASNGNAAHVTLAATKKNLYRFDDLYSLISKVDPAYRANGTLVFHDSSMWDLRNIKDDVNRPLWDVNNTLYQAVPPDKVGGYNFLISNSMDASGVFSKNIAWFGDLSRYMLRMVGSPQITRLNELYRAQGCIGFEVLLRFDGNYIGHASSQAVLATPAS